MPPFSITVSFAPGSKSRRSRTARGMTSWYLLDSVTVFMTYAYHIDRPNVSHLAERLFAQEEADGDGLVDYGEDPGCSAPCCGTEQAGCGLGYELGVALALLAALRRHPDAPVRSVRRSRRPGARRRGRPRGSGMARAAPAGGGGAAGGGG